jgi:hypothetical protein
MISNLTRGSEKAMFKQVKVNGQRVKLYSIDNGRTWSSSPQSIVAYAQRKEFLRRDLQKAFGRPIEIQEPDPNAVVELASGKSLWGR